MSKWGWLGVLTVIFLVFINADYTGPIATIIVIIIGLILLKIIFEKDPNE